MNNFRELVVWQKSMQLVEETYIICKEIPQPGKFTFGDQATRSALSIPSNIAEGAGRSSIAEFKRFIDIATGSSYELETQLLLIERLFKIETKNQVDLLIEVQKMMASLKRSLNQSNKLSTSN